MQVFVRGEGQAECGYCRLRRLLLVWAPIFTIQSSPVPVDPETVFPSSILAHGAGASSSFEWIVRWKKLLGEATNAVEVVIFDYPYCANGKKGAPPKAEKLVGSHTEEIGTAMSRHSGHPLVLVGKSKSSRELMAIFMTKLCWSFKPRSYLLRTLDMAPGSSRQPHNVMKDKDGGRRENNSQEAGASGLLNMLTNVDVNRMHVDSNQQSWPALSKSILPPPKKRHHPPNQNLTGQPASKVIYIDCKENKSERGGSLTSRISSLSPGTKRKMLGYAADGSIPPLPPRQKRVKKTLKLTGGDGKLCTKLARSAEPSGLLGDLKPGIMRQQTRTRTEIQAVLSAVVGDLLQRDTLPVADGLRYELQVNDRLAVQLEELPTESSDLNRWAEETSDQPTGTSLQDSLDDTTDSPKMSGQSNFRFADAADDHFDVGLRKCKGVINTSERTSGFVPFQRNGLHACNRNVPVLPADSRSLMPAVAQRDATSHSQQAQLPVTMKQERDIILFQSKEERLSEAFQCKQEDLEEDLWDYPIDLSDTGSLRHEDAQRQESQLLMPVSGANVATYWLELLSLDVKGRLAALKRSKRRVETVMESGELDLDAPLLPGCATSLPTLNHHPDGQLPVDGWRKVFESMNRALTLEGQKLKSWLQQIHVMQSECQRDTTLSSSIRPASLSEPPPPRAQDVQHVAVPLPSASKVSAASFTSQFAEFSKDLII